MNRIGIFVFYDAGGIVDNYIEILLDSLSEIIKKLIIIVNGKINPLGYHKFKKYTKDIFIRDNYGYDAGAYKDALLKFLSHENWKIWDEIILFNDTFYAPIYSWEPIFKQMEAKKSDFWGLSRHPECRSVNNTNINIPSHIQAYFLVCKKSMFLSNYWLEFWNNLDFPKIHQEAIKNFEIDFSVFFSKKGFAGIALTDTYQIKMNCEKNPYASYSYELIKYGKFPIIKRKAIMLYYFAEAKRAICYIKSETNYDINYIILHLERLIQEKNINVLEPFEQDKLEIFYRTHKNIYIYGHGQYGKGMATYFEYREWKYKSFIVTQNTENNANLSVYKDIHFEKEDGVILALCEAAFTEVYPQIKSELDESQLYYPDYSLKN